MSRVGKKPVKLPSGVQAVFKAPIVEISGKQGKLHRTLPSTISVEVKGDQLFVNNLSDNPEKRALHGLSRSLIQNMVVGVSQGYSRELELQGVGYRAQVQGNKLNLQLGFSHPVEFPLPEGISASVEANTKILLKGADKELLGQTASSLRKVRPPEPYKGKGIRYQGEVVTLKQGKAAGTAGGAK
ncbi:MAG: 50S ribosomal protein L6 [Deltaproteobacteria bacterium]|nr:50S ribosomal protein L6 [Deltaproteobacteria bacterium]